MRRKTLTCSQVKAIVNMFLNLNILMSLTSNMCLIVLFLFLDEANAVSDVEGATGEEPRNPLLTSDESDLGQPLELVTNDDRPPTVVSSYNLRPKSPRSYRF